MSIDFRKSKFNSPSAGSAWVLFARPGPSGESGPPQVQAIQGANVYAQAQENIQYRYRTQTRISATTRASVENPRAMAEDPGTGGAITRGDLAMLKAVLDSLDFGEGVGRDQLNGMMNLVQEAITANRMTSKVMSILWWQAYGVGASIPWFSYACPEDAEFPALGVAPPTPSGSPTPLLTPLTIANDKNAIPVELRPADFATMPASAGTAYNPLGGTPGAAPPTDWMMYLLWAAIVLAALGAAIGVYYIAKGVSRRAKEKKELEAGQSSRGRLPAGQRGMARTSGDPVASGYTVAHEAIVV